MAWYGEEARTGNPDAQFLLAYALETGVGEDARPQEARTWYQAAAEQGHVRAQVRLALMQAEGRGGARDVSAARTWLDQAAREGDVDAMSLLGFLLVAEDPIDPVTAYRWLRLASDAGDAAASGNLALLVNAMSSQGQVAAQAALDAWLADQ